MNAVAQHKTRHIVSEIDIQLWAREQRRRWFARTFGTPLRRLALGLRVMSRLAARGCVRRLFQSAPSRGDSDAQFGYSLATLPSRVYGWRNRPFGYAPDRLGAVGPTIDVDVAFRRFN